MIQLYDVYKSRLTVEVKCDNKTELEEFAKGFQVESVEVSHQNIFFVNFSDTDCMDAFLKALK